MKFRKKNLVESPSPTKTDSSNSPSSDSSSPRHATSTSSRRHRLMRLPRRRPKPEEPIQQLPSAHSLQTSLHNTTTKTLIDNTDSPTAAAADGPDNHDDDPQQPPQRELVRTGSFKTIHPSRLSQYYNDDHAGHTTRDTNDDSSHQDETKASIHPDRRLERQLEHRFLSSEERMSDGKEIADIREHPSIDKDTDVLDTTSSITEHKADASIHVTTTTSVAASADNNTLRNESLHPSRRSPEENKSIEKEEALLLETNPLVSNDSTKNTVGTSIEKEVLVSKEEAIRATNVDKAAKANNKETPPSVAAVEASHDERNPTETTGPLHTSPTTTTSPSIDDSSIGIVEASDEAVGKIKPALDVKEMESVVLDEVEPTSPPSRPLHASKERISIDEAPDVDTTEENRDSSETIPAVEADQATAPNATAETSDEENEIGFSEARLAHVAKESERGLIKEQTAPNDVAEARVDKDERDSTEVRPVHDAEKVESGLVDDNRERDSSGTRSVAEESESGLIDEKTATNVAAVDTNDEKRERDSSKSRPAHETEEMENGLVNEEAAPNKEIGTSAEKEERNFNEAHEAEKVESGLIEDEREGDPIGTKPVHVAIEWENGLIDDNTAPNVAAIETSDEKRERDSSKTRPARGAEGKENGLVDEKAARNDVVEVSADKEERDSSEGQEAEKVESLLLDENRRRDPSETRPAHVAEKSESGPIEEKAAPSVLVDASDKQQERDSSKSRPTREAEEKNGLVDEEAALNDVVKASADEKERDSDGVHDGGKVESGLVDYKSDTDSSGTEPVHVTEELESGLIDEKTAPNVAAVERTDEKRERDSSETRSTHEAEEIENGSIDEEAAPNEEVGASADKKERDSSEVHDAEKVESGLLDDNIETDSSGTRPVAEESESGLIDEKNTPNVAAVEKSDEKRERDSSKTGPARGAEEIKNMLVYEEAAPNEEVGASADKKERAFDEVHDAEKVESGLVDDERRDGDHIGTKLVHDAEEPETGLVDEKVAPSILVDASDEKREKESNKTSSADEAEETAPNEAIETSDEKRRRDCSEVRPLHEAEEVGNMLFGVETGWETGGTRPSHDAEESASGLINENTTPNVAVESSDEESERDSSKVTRARVGEELESELIDEERGRDSSGTRPAPDVEESVSQLIDNEAAPNAVVGATDSRGTETNHETEEVESGSTDDEAAPNAAVETNDEHRRKGYGEWSLGHDAEQREWGLTDGETAPNTVMGKNDEKKENDFGKRRITQLAEESVMLIDEKNARNEAAEMTDEKRQRDYNEARAIFEAKKARSELTYDMAAKAVVETVDENSCKDSSETRPSNDAVESESRLVDKETTPNAVVSANDETGGSKSSETSPAQETEESAIGSVDELEVDANDKKNVTESNETRPAHDMEEFECKLSSEEITTTTVVGEENGMYPSEVRQTDEAKESDRGLIVEEPAANAANDEDSGRNPPYDFEHDDFVQTKTKVIKACGREMEKSETAVASSEERTADHSTFGRRCERRAAVHKEDGAALDALQSHVTENHSEHTHSDDLDLPDVVVQNRMEMHDSNERKPVAESTGNVDKSVFMMKGTDRWEISANPASRIAANLTYQEMRFPGQSTHKSSSGPVSADGLDLDMDETSKSNKKEGGAPGLETAVLSLEDGSEISDITSIRSKEIHASTTDPKLSWKVATDTILVKGREAPKIEAAHGNVDPRRDQDETYLPVPQKLKLDRRQPREKINDGFEHNNNEVTGKQQFIHPPSQVDHPHLYVDEFWQDGGHARSRRNSSEMVIRRLHLSPRPEVTAGERTSELPKNHSGNAPKGQQPELEAGISGKQSRERFRYEHSSNEAVTGGKQFIHSPLQVEHPHLTVDQFWREDGHTRASQRNSSEMVIRQFHLSPRPVAATGQPIPGLQKSQSGDIAEGEQLQSEGDVSGKGRREGNKRERDKSNQAPQKTFGCPSTIPFGDYYKGRRGIVAESGYSQSLLPQEDTARPKTDQKRSPYHEIWMDDIPSRVSVYRNKPVETLRDLMSPLGLSNLYHLVRHRTSVSKRTAMFLRRAPDPFWNGVEYRLYKAQLAKDVNQLDAQENQSHLKSLRGASGSQPYFEQMECSEVASFLAEAYNISPHRPSHCAKIYILQQSVVEATERRDESTKCFFLAERPLPSEDPVTTYCDDTGHWTRQPDESLVRFSAFTFNITKKYLMAAHFQGIRIANRFILVDPAILCEDSERFGSLNPGRAAMTRCIESTFSILKKNGWKI